MSFFTEDCGVTGDFVTLAGILALFSWGLASCVGATNGGDCGLAPSLTATSANGGTSILATLPRALTTVALLCTAATPGCTLGRFEGPGAVVDTLSSTAFTMGLPGTSAAFNNAACTLARFDGAIAVDGDGVGVGEAAGLLVSVDASVAGGLVADTGSLSLTAGFPASLPLLSGAFVSGSSAFTGTRRPGTKLLRGFDADVTPG